MKLSRKHYCQLAGIIGNKMEFAIDLLVEENLAAVARDLADFCAEHGQNFDRMKFYAACGLTETGEPI